MPAIASAWVEGNPHSAHEREKDSQMKTWNGSTTRIPLFTVAVAAAFAVALPRAARADDETDSPNNRGAGRADRPVLCFRRGPCFDPYA